MAFTRNSRLNHTVVVDVVNSLGELVERQHMDIRPRLVSTISSDNHEVLPTRGDNWSRISWRVLGNGRLWWIIADHSGIVDPYLDLLPIKRVQYIAQLTAPLPSGDQTTITVDQARRFNKGRRYFVEDLDPASPSSEEIFCTGVDKTTGIITFQRVTVTTTIPASLSRVSLIKSDSRKLTVPGVNRALFEALDFNNSLTTLVE